MSRPSSAGLSIYKDHLAIQFRAKDDLLIDRPKSPEEKSDEEKEPEKIPGALPLQAGDDEELPPLNDSRSIMFKELVRRWRTSRPGEMVRSELLMMILKHNQLYAECIIPENQYEFLILLKSALASPKY